MSKILMMSDDFICWTTLKAILKQLIDDVKLDISGVQKKKKTQEKYDERKNKFKKHLNFDVKMMSNNWKSSKNRIGGRFKKNWIKGIRKLLNAERKKEFG